MTEPQCVTNWLKTVSNTVLAKICNRGYRLYGVSLCPPFFNTVFLPHSSLIQSSRAAVNSVSASEHVNKQAPSCCSLVLRSTVNKRVGVS